MRPIRSLLVSLVLAATIAALALGTASATFPGHDNGRIAFGVRLPDGSANIFSINPDGSAKRQLTTAPATTSARHTSPTAGRCCTAPTRAAPSRSGP